jgi:hypothetical protein
VFAGAAREAVFSNPEVIRRVNADFVPVALKAALVNNPPRDEEGRLYGEIGRSKPAPQGICVANSAGKVLAWALMFDDDKSVLAFLDHTRKRFAQFPDARQNVAAERYMKFPTVKLEDVEDTSKALAIPERHAKGKACPAQTGLPEGTMIARLFGRALAKDGKPVADTVRQENYVEDRFHVPVAMQEELAKALTQAGTERFRLADDLARLLVSHAYLGQLDVNPVGGVPGGKGALKQCEFWAQKIEARGSGPVQVRVEGNSEAAGGSSDGQGGDGRLWQHEVKLTWEGIIEMKKNRMAFLLLVARGSEKIKWGNDRQELKAQADVTLLPGGHAIDLGCGVRYGIIGEPVPQDLAGTARAAAEVMAQQIPDEARRQLVQVLGGPFLVFRDRVQEELKLSEKQKQKLAEKLPDYVQGTMKVFEKVKDLKPQDREKEMQEHRRASDQSLSALLKDVLEVRQQERLLQLQLQQAGAFALLGQHEAFIRLKITDEQRKKFMEVVQEMQNKIEPLLKKVQMGSNPEEIRPQVVQIRKDHETKIEAVLTEIQKKAWQELLGKPFDLGD